MDATADPIALFRSWRKGDRDAGQAMGQIFADWYYAITTSRMGEEAGRAPCATACRAFSSGIASVRRSDELVAWAHNLVLEHIPDDQKRVMGGNQASRYTNGVRPWPLLVEARSTLPAEMKLLEASYHQEQDKEAIAAASEPFGAGPIGVLRARATLKHWLRTEKGIGFEITPESPNLDRAPMPLYESGQMGTADEEVQFERWMISDINLCRDIAEFAHFSIALRGGYEPSVASQSAAKRPWWARLLDVFRAG